MAKDKLVYNVNHIKSISDKYKLAANKIDEILEAFISIDDSSALSKLYKYKGQAEDVMMQIFVSIKKHLELLQSCCNFVDEYICESLETMIELDKSI